MTQRQEVGGDAEVHIIVEFPQADRCFTDERIETYDQLKECLEIVTNNKWTIDVAGQVVEVLEDALPGDKDEPAEETENVSE